MAGRSDAAARDFTTLNRYAQYSWPRISISHRATGNAQNRRSIPETLFSSVVYDRCGPWTLVVLPAMVTAVPTLAFGTGLTTVVAGILLWGAATGVQDSTVKALVAELVPHHRRATAYGLFAAVQGAGALAGGATAGALYQHSTTTLIIAVAISQAVALLVLVTHFATTRAPQRY